MKRLIDFCLLLLMVFWGSNAWADKTMTFSATSPTSDCNLTKLNVPRGTTQSIKEGGINQTGGLDNTVQAYPYTWNFTDESLWEKSKKQFVSEKHLSAIQRFILCFDKSHSIDIGNKKAMIK